MADTVFTPQQARIRLYQIVQQHGLDIGEIEAMPIKLIRESLRRFDLGLLPDRLSLQLSCE